MRSNIPEASACGVYISQLIRDYWVCGFFQDLGLLLGSELLNKWFLLSKLKSSLSGIDTINTFTKLAIM
jgi:hypothetical protein